MVFKRRVQLLVALLITLVSTILTLFYLYHEKQAAAERSFASAQNIKSVYDSIRKDLEFFYTYRAYANLRSEGIKEAMLARDTQALYDLTLPRYKTLCEENPNLRMMQFHAPDGKSILRMHRKDVFGDDIAARRPMVRMTHRTKTLHAGFEGGIEGIAYRIIVPLVEKNEYLGALEFGIDPDYMIGKLIDTTKMDTLFMLHESRMAAADMNKYGTRYSGYQFSHLSPYQRPLVEEFVKDNPGLNDKVIQYKEKNYQVIHIHLNDNNGKAIGLLISFNDITTGYQEIAKVIIGSFVLTVLMILILLGIVEYVFSRMTKKMMFQERYLDTVMNAQKNMIIVMDEEEIIYVNNAVLDYLHYRTLEEFCHQHRSISELFETAEGEEYLKPEMNGITWTNYILLHAGKEHKVKMTVDGKRSTFSVHVKAIEYENKRHFVIVFSDITDLNNLATLDKLTQIANRFEFDKILEHSIAISRRHERPLSLLILDLDHFKQVNDRFGHLIGDEVLKSFSQLLRNQIRQSDVVARWGGEEFIILLQDTSLASAIKMAEALRQRIEVNAFETVGHLTCSIGVAEFNSIEEADDLLHRADEQLYRAKHGGRNRVVG